MGFFMWMFYPRRADQFHYTFYNQFLERESCKNSQILKIDYICANFSFIFEISLLSSPFSTLKLCDVGGSTFPENGGGVELYPSSPLIRPYVWYKLNLLNSLLSPERSIRADKGSKFPATQALKEYH